jgi:cytochrome c5
MDRLKAIVILFAAAIFAVSCGQADTNSGVVANNGANAPANIATPSPAAEIALSGKELYAKNCMICHKESGKGGKVTIEGKTIDPDDVTTARMKAKPDEKLYEYISEGFPDDGMPAYKDKLSKDQIKAIVGHLRTLQGS